MRRFVLWIKEGTGKLRRYYLSHCRPGYVARMRKLRRGECKRCGKCCSLFWRCPFLKNEYECDIYESRFKPCRNFPIDERDITGVCSDCGHYFVTESEAEAEEEAGN